ncbi:FliM/FliN family flagellar motor switch protein [Xylophilus ampelinus]|uniref:FliM/FliN family flagellar motor switch protein n=1 Tax=Xylophilus ampelinus TaxID=54067 RepID=UPI001314791A|nr:FliM/FliN family flagellar motor switch protein [Xylophilus ampelinus]MCS4510428.1 FliM/FliN family flagellar motor switch protein [Xylophilus ampelinus]
MNPDAQPVLTEGLADLRLALPSLPMASAAAARIAFDSRCSTLLSRYLGGATVKIGRRHGQRPGLRVALSSLVGDMVVELDPRRCAAWALLDRLAREPQQQDLACALASEMVDRVCRDRGYEDVGLEIRALTASDTALATTASVATLRIDEHEIELLEMDAAFSLFAAEEMRERPVVIPPMLRSLRLSGTARLGERRLGASQWILVAPGDIFLLGRSPLQIGWRIGAGQSLHASARLECSPPGPRAPQPLLTLETALLGPKEEAVMDTPDAVLAEIELPVQFELQTTSLPLEEIAALGPGHVIALDVPVEQAVVQLMCQGRCVGSGQLVVVGDHLGVRIDRMAWARDAAVDS